jgi:hypothetical protein
LTHDVLGLVADAYRRSGPLGQRIAARSFLDVLPREVVERQLGGLLDSGDLVPGPGGTVGLSLHLRASFLSRAVLCAWVEEIGWADADSREVMRAAVRAELREVARYCLGAPAASGLGRHGVELMAVLATAELDPRAIDVVRDLPGTRWMQLDDLVGVPEGSCRTLKDLQVRVRHYLAAVAPPTARV